MANQFLCSARLQNGTRYNEREDFDHFTKREIELIHKLKSRGYFKDAFQFEVLGEVKTKSRIR